MGYSVEPLQKIYMRQHATYQFTSTVAAQKIFNGTANGRVTLPVGAYTFTCMMYLTGMSATSGNGSFSLVAGSAVISSFLMNAVGMDTNDIRGQGNKTGSFAYSNAFQTNTVSTGIGTEVAIEITGSFEVNTAGTVTPSFALTTAATPTLSIGSYIEFVYLGLDSSTYSGNWD